MDILRTGSKYQIIEVAKNKFHLVKVLKEFKTWEEAQEELLKLLQKDKFI